jgi:methionine synthase II (cobalamin-independent)
LPGDDIAEAVRIVLGELPDLPHLPELPGRGPGADMIGRTAGLLVELPVDLYAGRWRVASRPGVDLRRTRDLWARDLDTLTELAEGLTGPLKVQAAGPWTMAASLDLPIGGRMLRDHGAVDDLAASLAEGLRAHLADVAGRLPGASLILQLDEPSLPAVLAGQVPTESGWQTLRAVDVARARSTLRSVVDAVGVPLIVHCCARGVPLDLIRESGAAGLAIDLDLLEDLDSLGEAIDAGLGLLAGAVPTSAPTAAAGPTSAGVADRVRDMWRKIGFDETRLARQVVVTPACGLAGATDEYARSALRACREAGRRIHDLGE